MVHNNFSRINAPHTVVKLTCGSAFTSIGSTIHMPWKRAWIGLRLFETVCLSATSQKESSLIHPIHLRRQNFERTSCNRVLTRNQHPLLIILCAGKDKQRHVAVLFYNPHSHSRPPRIPSSRIPLLNTITWPTSASHDSIDNRIKISISQQYLPPRARWRWHKPSSPASRCSTSHHGRNTNWKAIS